MPEAEVEQELMLATAEEKTKTGDTAGALEILQTAASQMASAPPSDLQSRVLRETGLAWRTLGDVEESSLAYTEALNVARACGSREEEAFALNGLAVAKHIEGDLELADQQYAQAARLAAAAGLIRLTGMVEQNRGVIANIRGDLEKAQRRYRAALAAFEMTRDRQGVAWTLNNLGMLHADMDEGEKALQAFRNALAAAQEASDVELQARVRINWAGVLIHEGVHGEARTSLTEVLQVVGEGGFELLEAEALTFLGKLERACGDPSLALTHLSSAMEIGEAAPDRLLVAEAARESGACWMALGDPVQARAAWQAAATNFDALGADRDLADVKQRLVALGD